MYWSAVTRASGGRAGMRRRAKKVHMTICPIAVAVSCKKCPAFSLCPLKGVIGDYRKLEDAPPKVSLRMTKIGGSLRAGCAQPLRDLDAHVGD